MYGETLSNTNLRALADIQDINTITASANGLLGELKDGATLAEETLRARRIQYFYDRMLLDTLALGSENNVYLKYATTKEVPPGHAKLLLRRWSGLTEHIVPLKEGIPPKSDFMRSESFEATFAQYGRYMEFSDRVDFNIIDPVIAMKTAQYGDLAVRTAERLAREEMLQNSGEVWANAKGIDELLIGDNIGIEDYRLMAIKLERILVKPINGNYIVICSPEHLYDLVTDPLVEKYMNYTNTAEPFKTGMPVPLFSITFEKTMFDDFGFNYAGTPTSSMLHPGEYAIDAENDEYGLRCYTVLNKGETDEEIYYVNVETSVAWDPASTNAANMAAGAYRRVQDEVIADGSYIPEKISWFVPWDSATAFFAHTKTVEKQGATGDDGIPTSSVITLADNTAHNTLIGLLKAATWYEIPVHKSFMFGQEYLTKTGISGRTGAQIFVKEKGSAGVLDPINQRQSIGFKIDAIGFTNVREEAIQTFYFIPTKAAITQQWVVENQPTWANTFNT